MASVKRKLEPWAIYMDGMKDGYSRGRYAAFLEAASELELWAATGQELSALHDKWMSRAKAEEVK